MVNCTSSTAGSLFKRFRHERPPLCGSPVTRSTRIRSRIPEISATKTLLLRVNSPSAARTVSSTVLDPRRSISIGIEMRLPMVAGNRALVSPFNLISIFALSPSKPGSSTRSSNSACSPTRPYFGATIALIRRSRAFSSPIMIE